MVYMRRRPLLHVSADRRPTGPEWLPPILANVQWVAGVVTALGSLLVVTSLIESGETMAGSAFFVLETGVGQYTVVVAAIVWAALVIRAELESTRVLDSNRRHVSSKD